jgi:hypothetical protein
MASNLAAIVVGIVVWPLSCLVLVRQTVGRSATAMLLTPAVALGFAAFPWSLMTFGVLWPNLLGLALVPVALGVVITLAGFARDSAIGRGRALVIGAVCVVALGFAHPNTVFSLVALSLFPVGWYLASRTGALIGAKRRAAAVATASAGLAGAAVVGYFWVLSPLFARQRAFDWPAYQSTAQAAGEVLLLATNTKDAAWAISIAVIVGGAFAAARGRNTRWLIPAHGVSATLFIVASALETDLAPALTGIWYNDSHRLAAMLPVTGVPLAVLGLLAAGPWAADAVRGGRRHESIRRPTLVTAAAALGLLVLSGGMYVRDHSEFMATAYPVSGERGLSSDRRDFIERVGDAIPPGSIVAQNPWSGNALLYALAGREVLFPHLDGAWTADQRYLAANLRDVATDPRVCSIALRLGVDHALLGPIVLDPWDDRAHDYPGIAGLDRAPGFEVLATDGAGSELYRITACSSQPGDDAP